MIERRVSSARTDDVRDDVDSGLRVRAKQRVLDQHVDALIDLDAVDEPADGAVLDEERADGADRDADANTGAVDRESSEDHGIGGARADGDPRVRGRMDEGENARRGFDRQRLGDRDRAVAARVEDDRLSSRIELEDRSREGLARGEDVVAGVGVVAGARGDEDAVGESDRVRRGARQKGSESEKDTSDAEVPFHGSSPVETDSTLPMTRARLRRSEEHTSELQ